MRICLLRSGFQFIADILLAGMLVTTGWSQNAAPPKSSASKSGAAVVTGVRVVHERDVLGVEVAFTHPVVPAIQVLDSPPRLVMDLVNAQIGLTRKRIPVQQENILTIRAEQYQIEPPVVRIVLDLLAPYGYVWDSTGNRLLVRLRPPGSSKADADPTGKKSPFQLPQAVSLTPDEMPAVVPVSGGMGEAVVADRVFAAGSSLTAGSETTVLQLSRGGEVRVCPRTTVSVTPSKNAKDLMLGMSTGAMETHYSLDASTDTVLTPDFRIRFAGPGEFHFAVSADSQGNTCVRGLPGNASPATVSELLGDRSYQVKPSEQAVFRLGRIDKVDSDVPLECGCPRPVAVMRASASPAPPVADSNLPANVTLAEGGTAPEAPTPSENGDGHVLSNGPEIRPLPPSRPNEVRVQVDAPLVFQAKHRPPAAPTREVEELPVIASTTQPVRLDPQVLPPRVLRRAKRENPLRRIARIFYELFH
jgi:AMIN domain